MIVFTTFLIKYIVVHIERWPRPSNAVHVCFWNIITTEQWRDTIVGFDAICGVVRFLENNNIADTTAIRFDGNLGNVFKSITNKKIRFVLLETKTHRLRHWSKTLACLFMANTARIVFAFSFRRFTFAQRFIPFAITLKYAQVIPFKAGNPM